MRTKKKNDKYIRGRRYEYKALQELEEQGYLTVRSSGSKGLFDIWALNKNELKLIQCKATKSNNNNFSALINDLKQVMVPSFCTKEIWVWFDRKGWKKIIV